MISKVWINDLLVGQDVELDVMISAGEAKTGKSANVYFDLILADRTGKITARRFNPSLNECAALSSLQFVHVCGRVEMYKETRQLKLSHPLQDIGTPDDLEPYLPCSAIPLKELKSRLKKHIDSVCHPSLHALLSCIFAEGSAVGDAFCTYPAALENHHAFRHGLLQHTLEVTDIVATIATCQQNWGCQPINHDLVITGALLHDIGKAEEMRESNYRFEFSEAGSFLGHIMLGTVFIARQIAKVKKQGVEFSTRLEQMLLHLIASHHGKGEWGSPKAPVTPEAVLLHMADKTSTDLYYFHEARGSAEAGKEFAWHRKLDSGFGGAGRFVYVGDMGCLSQTEHKLVDEPEPVGYPIPAELRLPFLRFINDDEDTANIVVRSLPLMGRIAAGQPLLNSAFPDGHILVEATHLGKGDHYLLKVEGDSMTGDGIEDGDLVVVHQQDQAGFNELIVALLDNEGATLKRLVRQNGNILLMPSNPTHQPIPVPNLEELKIQGCIVGIVRS